MWQTAGRTAYDLCSTGGACSEKIGNRLILNDVSMKVRAGEIYGFLGANGAGKTSFMKSLYGMINKSVIATVVSSIAIVAAASNSQGTTAG